MNCRPQDTGSSDSTLSSLSEAVTVSRNLSRGLLVTDVFTATKPGSITELEIDRIHYANKTAGILKWRLPHLELRFLCIAEIITIICSLFAVS